MSPAHLPALSHWWSVRGRRLDDLQVSGSPGLKVRGTCWEGPRLGRTLSRQIGLRSSGAAGESGHCLKDAGKREGDGERLGRLSSSGTPVEGTAKGGYWPEVGFHHKLLAASTYVSEFWPPNPVHESSANLRRDDALAFLLARIDYERTVAIPYGTREFKLDRMRRLMARLGNPQDRLSIVHVAGTKGKGSTAAMIGAVLSAAGYRTGLFSSPHLDRVEERLMIDGQPCSADELIELVDELQPVVADFDAAANDDQNAEPGPTYFELTTAMALMHFARRGVEAAVLEVGLGGRLDSTNVCQPLVSVITSISFDHTKQLGNTLAAIAREKAGIIKPGVPVVSGVITDEPRHVIEEIAQARGANLLQLGRDFDFSYRPPRDVQAAAMMGQMDYREHVSRRQPSGDGQASANSTYLGIELRLLGRHQAANAAVALATLDELQRQGWRISESAIRAGLASVRWPARVEVVGRRPTVIIDAGHNVASIAALLATLDESFSARRRILVFATTQEKDVRGMLIQLLPRFDHVLFTRYSNNPRGVPAEELQALARELSGQKYPVCVDPTAAWQEVHLLAAPDDLVCITGSFFIAAEMRGLIDSRPLCALAAT
jgi:dihydrofolate synthase/folylpolyglutamate synthase